MDHKERNPVNRRVIKSGTRKGGLIDMSINPSEAKTSVGGEVDIQDLLQMVRQVQPPNLKKRTRRD